MTQPNKWILPVGAKRFFSEAEWQRMKLAYAIAQAMDEWSAEAERVNSLIEIECVAAVSQRADELLKGRKE